MRHRLASVATVWGTIWNSSASSKSSNSRGQREASAYTLAVPLMADWIQHNIDFEGQRQQAAQESEEPDDGDGYGYSDYGHGDSRRHGYGSSGRRRMINEQQPLSCPRRASSRDAWPRSALRRALSPLDQGNAGSCVRRRPSVVRKVGAPELPRLPLQGRRRSLRHLPVLGPPAWHARNR